MVHCRRMVYTAVFLGVLAAARAVAGAPQPPGGGQVLVAQPALTQSVVVMPFVNITGEPGDDWIGAGIAETVTADLRMIDGLAIVGRESASDALGTLRSSERVEPDDRTAMDIGRRLGAAWLVSGGYQHLGDRVRITARLADVASGSVVGTVKIDGAVSEIFGLQDEIVEGLRRWLTAPMVASDASESDRRVLTPATPAARREAAGPASRSGQGPASAAPAERAAGASAAAPQDAGSRPANPIDYSTARFERIVRAGRVTDRITIDGRLNEPAWQRVEPATNFIQWEPDPGMPASEDTEVRFLYDDDNLYVGARCWDSDAAQLTVHVLNQDFPSRQEDVLAFFLDSLNDRQSGFSFWTNPAGARRDVQVFQDDAQRSVDWDGVWDVKVAIDKTGWTAEFVIPFKTLRFSNSPKQEWGLNILRRVRRKNEDAYWSPLPRRYRTMRPSMGGTLTGLENIRQGRNLKIKPYVISKVTQLASSSLSSDLDGDAGLDVKYGLTPSLTLDLTYRTEFSQVEADQQRVNLTRFNLFFPEKREFFLENSGMFAVGRAGNSANVIPFFSRRIGLSETGRPIPIVGGARMSGTVGTYDVGLLTMNTERSGNGPSNTFVVGRLRKNFQGNSSAGVIMTSRDSTRSDDYNRLYGVDVLLRFFQRKLEVSSHLLRTETPDLEGRDQARLLEAAWRDNDFTVAGRYETVQPNFNPEVGFVRRTAMTHYSGDGSWQPRASNNRHVRNYDLAFGADLYLDDTGHVETRQQTIGTGIAFQNSSMLAFNVTDTFDRLLTPFAIRPTVIIPVGDYTFRRYSLNYTSDRGRALSGNINVSAGEFWDGQSWSARGGLELRPSYHLNIDLSFSRNNVDLPSGDFTTTLLGLRVLYAFTSNAFFNSFLQFNTTTNQLSANTRLNIIHRPLSDLYVVYNDLRDTTSGSLLQRELIVKFTNLFDF